MKLKPSSGSRFHLSRGKCAAPTQDGNSRNILVKPTLVNRSTLQGEKDKVWFINKTQDLNLRLLWCLDSWNQAASGQVYVTVILFLIRPTSESTSLLILLFRPVMFGASAGSTAETSFNMESRSLLNALSIISPPHHYNYLSNAWDHFPLFLRPFFWLASGNNVSFREQ